jgi:hypothetical protein
MEWQDRWACASVRVRHSRDEVLGDVGACAYLLLEEMWAVVEAATPM